MNAEAIAKALGGRKAGGAWSCRCPAHDDRNPSLVISDGNKGLLVHCYAGCEPIDVLSALRRLRLVDGRPLEQPRHRHIEHRDDDAQRTAVAQRIWRESKPAERSPAAAYLGNRGYCGPIPPTIRYHPSLKHSATGLLLPCMVAAVTVAPDCRVVAVHRTFLLADGRGKAPVTPDKMMLGPCGGGAVRLAPAGPTMIVCEGLETGLSLLAATGLPVWAALSAGGVESLVLPPLPLAGEVVIAADNDASGRGQRAAEVAAARFHADGRRVRIALPPEPGQDFNDLMMGCG
ncbi:MAG: toprim domain-containing protein [Rhodospirillales bacterium]|nr:toprim domain-containing protein [Rhodospirillales bacterium]